MKTQKNLIASAKSVKNLQNLLNEFFFSTSYKISDDLTISNKNGIFTKVIAIEKKNRYYLYANMYN